MDASVLDETRPKTAITGSCLHGKAGYQQSERRRRYRVPYLIGRPCRDHERRRVTEGNRARTGKGGGRQAKVKAPCVTPYAPLSCLAPVCSVFPTLYTIVMQVH